MRGASDDKTDRARELRHNSTRAELLLWNKLRARQLGGFKFVRQEPMGRYVADFVCRERRVIVELDGGQHDASESDRIRDKWLQEHNYRVMRFWNNDVMGNVNGVLETILSALLEAPPHPNLVADEVRPLPASGER